MSSRWSDASTWVGDRLRREVFFFESGGVQLYGSLFAATRPSRPFGVLCCASWGVEADRTDPLQRAVALSMARLGGAGMVFHYPGYGDSFGDLDDADPPRLATAAADAAAEAARRLPGLRWILAGFMLGASVACLAARKAPVAALALVQPALRPGEYFRWLGRTQRPLAPGPSPREMMQVGTDPGMSYGYPVPATVLERAAEEDAAVRDAAAAFGGDGAVICHERQRPVSPDRAPARFRRVYVEGRWRFGSLSHPALTGAAVDWLEAYTADGG